MLWFQHDSSLLPDTDLDEGKPPSVCFSPPTLNTSRLSDNPRTNNKRRSSKQQKDRT
jgi:hypothetical protein